MNLKATILLLGLMIHFSIPVSFAQSSQQTSAEKFRQALRAYFERRNRASQTWEELSSLLLDAQSKVNVRSFIGKEIMFDALLSERTNHLLMLKGEHGVIFKVKISRNMKLSVADTTILTVLGKVEEINREGLIVKVKADEVSVLMAE